MTLPSTGTISISQVDVEIGQAGNAPLNLGSLHGFASVPSSGPVSMSMLRGGGPAGTPAPTPAPGDLSITVSPPGGGYPDINTDTAPPGISEITFTFTPLGHGGSGGYTYTWTFVDRHGNAPSSAVVDGSSRLVLTFQYRQYDVFSVLEIWKPTVTDSLGAIAVIAEFQLIFNAYSMGGPGGD